MEEEEQDFKTLRKQKSKIRVPVKRERNLSGCKEGCSNRSMLYLVQVLTNKVGIN